MALDASRLNAARYSSALADIQAQFPIDSGLLGPEQATCASFQEKLAHAIADNEGTDVVDEITTNAVVPLGIAVTIPVTAAPGTPSAGATSAPGTVT
jgi:hypothetical protein